MAHYRAKLGARSAGGGRLQAPTGRRRPGREREATGGGQLQAPSGGPRRGQDAKAACHGTVEPPEEPYTSTALTRSGRPRAQSDNDAATKPVHPLSPRPTGKPTAA